MDHLRRKTLNLDQLKQLVLDEADEMLRMGFIEDVEWILEHTPEKRQVLLFSATMPQEIQHVAKRHTRDPIRIRVAQKEMTLPNIQQSYWLVQGLHKLDALTRILEAEPLEAAIIFSRTRAGCAELTECLTARGHRAEALHGDMSQAAREQVVTKMRSGKLQLIVATDVAARGLDIEGISHVINYDIPTEVEAYVHRIGRTGRAGRSGKAILFVSARERNMLRRIEHYTKQSIEPMKLPSYADVVAKRADILKARLLAAMKKEEALAPYQKVIEELATEGHDASQIAAAALRLAAGEKSLEVKKALAVKTTNAREKKPFRKDRPAKASAPYAKRTHGRPSPKTENKHPKQRGFKKSESGAPKPRGKRTFARKMSKR
jgi:ATP-dependent RNA helicase DeaD